MYDITSKVLKGEPTVVVRNRVAVSSIADWLSNACRRTSRAAGDRIAGPPFARFRAIGDDQAEVEIEAGFPVTAEVADVDGVTASSLPGGLAVGARHCGSYNTMGRTHQAIRDWLEEHGALPDGDPWEIYYSDPMEDPDPSTWQTELVQPYVAEGPPVD